MTFRSRALSVVLVLVGAACAGGSSGSTTTAGPGGTSTTAAGATTTTEAATTTTTLALPEATLWITDSANGILYSVNPMAVDDIVGEVDLGEGAESIVFGAGSVWVVGNQDGAVHRVDPANVSLETSITVGDGPAGVVFVDGLVYASNFGLAPDFLNTVHVIDPETNDVVAMVEAGNGGTGMAAGSALGVTFESGVLYRITQGSTGFDLETVELAHGLSELTAAEQFIFVTGIGSGELFRLNRDTLDLIDSITLGSSPNFIVYDGAGRVWVTDSAGSALWSVDIDTLEAVMETTIPTPTGIDVGMIDGKPWLFVASFNGGVYRIDPDDPAGSMTHIFTPLDGAGIYDVAFGNGG